MDKLPEMILDAGGNLVPTSSLQGHVLGLYFSAHWCPPCRGFTPKLSAWYSKFQQTHPDKKFSIVFVSSDKSQEDFNGYHKEMTFHALPFEHRDIKNSLSSEFKVRGIPTLIILNADGSFISRTGREIVDSDPTGANFPWVPKPFDEEMKGPLLSHDGKDHSFPEAVAGKRYVFYFSAHWCGPCRHFTPMLAELYKKLKAAGRDFEVIFVSGDRDDDSFGEYFGSMPWLAIPYGDPRIDFLNRHFEVEGIPTAILMDPSHRVLEKDFREVAAGDPEGAEFPWPRKPLMSIGRAMGGINEVMTVLVFTDGSEAQTQQAEAALRPLGEEELAACEREGRNPKIHFAVRSPKAEDDGEHCERLRAMLNLGNSSPLLFVVEVDSGRKYVHQGPIDLDTVRGVVQGFNAKTLATKGIRE